MNIIPACSKLKSSTITKINNSRKTNGGKQKLLGISKRGDNYIRKLLVQGARIICRWWNRRITYENEWRIICLQQITQIRGKFVAAVAQANKTARILWNILAQGVGYKPA